MTPLRTMMEDIGTRVHRPDDFQNCETNTSLILFFFFFLSNDRIFKHFLNLNTSQGNYYSVEQMT